MDKVSVVIAAYNVEKYIKRSVASALASTGVEIEVIVVDDASTDSTPRIVHNLALSDPRLRLVRLDKNGGPSHARNVGLSGARGKWIAYLDADDWWAPNRLERMIEVGETFSADIVADDAYLISEKESKPWGQMLKSSKAPHSAPYFTTAEHYVAQKWILHPMYRTDFLLDNLIYHDVAVRHGEDYLLHVEALCNGARFVVVPEPYYYYLVGRRGSITAEQQHHGDMLDAIYKSKRLAMRFGLPGLLRAIEEKEHVVLRDMRRSAIVKAVRAGKMGSALHIIARMPLGDWRHHMARMAFGLKGRFKRFWLNR